MKMEMTVKERNQKADELKVVWTEAVKAVELFETTVLINNDALVDIHNNLKNAVTLMVKEIRFLKFG